MAVKERHIFALRHMENGSFISALLDGFDYVICFSDFSSAFQFRADLGAVEHCEIVDMPIDYFPDGRLWLDGKKIIVANNDVIHHPNDKP